MDNGQTINVYTQPFTISAEKINKLKFRSIDNAGNEEDPKETEIKIDKTPPKVVINATPNVLWPANGKIIGIRITGSSTDDYLLKTTFSVSDSYNLIKPVLTDFGQTIQLEARRNGTDKEGRIYTVKSVAEDLAGNTTQSLVEVIVPHDQRK